MSNPKVYNNAMSSNSFISFNYKLLFLLILIFLLPSVYNTFRIYLLGNLPSDWGFNIASQLAWVNVIYEVIQEALILPLFFFLGRALENKEDFQNKVKTLLITSFIIYFAASILLMFSAKNLLIFLSQKEELIEASSIYIRIETAAILFSILYKCINIVFIVLEKIQDLLKVLILQVILTIIFDTFLVSTLPISLNLGVNGIAIGNIFVNLLLFLISLYLLRNGGINLLEKKKLSFTWQKGWLKVGWKSGLESFVRNTAFIIMVLKMINLVQEQGNFWVSLNFIWGWLLVPILALGELIKRDIGTNLSHSYIKQNIKSYYMITSFFIFLWLLTIPFYNFFLGKVLNVQDIETVFSIVIYSLIFYVLFAYNNILDSIFYGAGRTDLMLLQSLIVNTLIFGTFYVLFKINIFQPTLYKIVFLFGFAIAFDSFITFIIFYYLYLKNKLIKKIV